MVSPQPGGICVVEVRVRNFRCLCAIDVPLDRITVLIGENNAGKTSFLDALFLAIGAGPRAFSEDDVYLGTAQTSAPRDRRVTVDLLIRPTDATGAILPTFPASSPWLSLWGEGVTQNDGDQDIVSIRTQVKWDAVKGEYDATRSFLREWPTTLDDAQVTSTKNILRPVANYQLEPLALYLLDAKRDIAADLRNRSSFWSKLVSDPGLTSETIKEIEDTLNTVNERIVTGSTVLSHLQAHLSVLSDSLPGATTGVAITPVSRHLRDLTKGMDVLLSGTDTATLEARKVIAEIGERFGIRLQAPDISRLRPSNARRERATGAKEQVQRLKGSRPSSKAVLATHHVRGRPEDVVAFFRSLAE